MAASISEECAQYREENNALRMENQYLRASKLELIKATSQEMQRLRQFIALLSNALLGQGYTVKDMRHIRSMSTKKRKKREQPQWAYKAKEKNKAAARAPPVVSLLSAAPNNVTEEDSTEQPPVAVLSLKDRMKALEATSNSQNRASQKVEKLKAERKLDEVKVSQSSKSTIASLFADKIEKQKKAAVATGASGAGSKMLKAALKTRPEPQQAVDVLHTLGLFVAADKTPDFRKRAGKGEQKEEKEEKEEESLQVLNMNNNALMSKMSNTERSNMQDLVCDAMVANVDLKCVTMCNAQVTDDFLSKILSKLSSQPHEITELSLESNPIGDPGMKALAQFIEHDKSITTIKMYNNRKTISTGVLNQLLDALSSNTSIVKFVFDGFRFQHQKDRREKYLARNSELARRKRNEERKRLLNETQQK